ncbi:MAG: hypothetical protein KF795_01735 [Labilithrix sp.]|nr:hypothetical protein [Labilithrix sp.]
MERTAILERFLWSAPLVQGGDELYLRIMAQELTARDFWPLLLKLPHDERIRLARLALRAAATEHEDAASYASAAASEDEFGSDEEPLAWEGEGWEEFIAKG